MSDNISRPPRFRCPVCRAEQTPQPECRRCHADLRLTLRARQRLTYLLEQQAAAVRNGDSPLKAQIDHELRLLVPRQL